MKKLEISKKDLKYNISTIKKEIAEYGKDDSGNKTEIIAVVKANGMGLGNGQKSHKNFACRAGRYCVVV